MYARRLYAEEAVTLRQILTFL